MEFALTPFDIVLILSGVLYALYVYITWNYGRFKNSNVPYIKPSTMAGYFVKMILRTESLIENFGKMYKEFPNNRFIGTFIVRDPVLIIRDPELIREIAIKDFDHFSNHRPFIEPDIDPLFGSNLFFLRDQKWRDMRSTLSPAFTGSKMRAMYSLVSDCAHDMTEYLKKEIKEKGPQTLEMKELFTRFSNDVIATAAFGLKVNTLEDQDNIFYKMGKRATDLGSLTMTIKSFGLMLMPRVMKMLNIRWFDGECTKFFRDLVHDTMVTREKEGIVRPDMIHLLMQARQGTLQHDNSNTTLTQQQDAGFATVTESDVGKAKIQKRVWSDDELTAQAMIFFIAGFDNLSNIISFACYELVANPDVQKRLQQEIDEVCAELDNGNQQPDYEGINRMKYLDMVISEVLRKWPSLGFIDRICTKPYVLKDYDGNKYEIKKGEGIIFPAMNLHLDEKYYANPDKFDPERFSDENKKNIKPFTYLPFGVGPRNCIGSRFALMELKATVFNILKHFNIVPCEKTQIPIVLTKKPVLQPENGFWVSFTLREN